MLKSRVLIVVGILLATLCAAPVAMAQTVQDSTSVQRKVIYDPINYSQVRANLEWASKKTFWQRMVERFRAPLIKNNPDNKFQLTGSVGLGYMTETGVMFSAKAAAIYDKQIKGALDYPSTLSASAGVSVTGFYAINISGNNYFTDGKNRLSYSVDLSSLPIRFWGLGYEAADVNPRAEYKKKYHIAKVRYMRHIVDRFWLGANLDFRFGHGGELNALAESYLVDAGQTLHSAMSAGVGIVAEYDSRNSRVNTTRGIYISILSEMRPKMLSNVDSDLWHITAVVDLFQPVWQGGVLAVDLYSDLWSSATPWVYWPAVGGDYRMRGYYYGRYTDRKLFSGQVELRQNIYGPVSGCVWGGAASVCSSHKLFDLSELLPNVGLGLRVELGKSGRLRVDYGFGRNSNGLIVSINEAF